METRRDDFDLTAALRALRPSPSAAFADELDARLAAGFAKAGEPEDGLVRRLAQLFRNVTPRQLALPAGAVTLTAVVVATAVIAVGQEDPGPSGEVARLSHGGAEGSPAGRRGDNQFSDTPSTLSGGRPPTATSKSASGAGETSAGVGVPAGSSADYQLGAAPQTLAGAGHRAVERDAELVLRAEPGEIDEAANEVFAEVQASKGIVLNSSIRDWTANAGNRAREARASFELLIPTARLGDTLASLSRIADVRSRHESTLDITAPTVGVAERVSDAEARIESLLTQLASAKSDEERTAVESELHRQRKQAAALHGQLDRLRDRARFAHVSLRIESGQAAADSGSSSWGVDDALSDAGRILTIAAGVAVIGVAVLGPLALILLLAFLAHRAWVHQHRERALG